MPKMQENDHWNDLMQFHLPRYEEIPNIGLYLDQTAKYINSFFEPLGDVLITPSMISNYVKHDLLPNPVKKQYHQEQIAYLFFITIAKTVLSLSNIQILLTLQKEQYSLEQAYEYFRNELHSTLFHVFGLSKSMTELEENASLEKKLCRNTIVAVSHKIYLDRSIGNISEKAE